jgi:hypothetical protein
MEPTRQQKRAAERIDAKYWEARRREVKQLERAMRKAKREREKAEEAQAAAKSAGINITAF